MYFETTLHALCIAVMTVKRDYKNGISKLKLPISDFALLPKGSASKNKGNALILNPLVRICEQGFHVQALLIFADIVFEEVAGCVSPFVAGCVIVVVLIIFMAASITFAF